MNRFYELAKRKGWWDGVINREKVIPEKLALIHSEVSEALEDFRDSKMEIVISGEKPTGFPIELADVIIRVYDLAGALGIDLDEAVEIKHNYNKTRPFRHGGKRA